MQGVLVIDTAGAGQGHPAAFRQSIPNFDQPCAAGQVEQRSIRSQFSSHAAAVVENLVMPMLDAASVGHALLRVQSMDEVKAFKELQGEEINLSDSSFIHSLILKQCCLYTFRLPLLMLQDLASYTGIIVCGGDHMTSLVSSVSDMWHNTQGRYGFD